MHVHFVWATWHRLPLIPAELRSRLYAVMRAAFEKRGCEVAAIGGMPDHVHALVAVPATVTLADLAHDGKGASSRWMNEQPGVNGEFRWQGRYAAISVSPHDRTRVVSYIVRQEDHDRDGTLGRRRGFRLSTAVVPACAGTPQG